MTANSFTSLSLDPPLVLFCVGKTTHMSQAIRHATRVLRQHPADRTSRTSRRTSPAAGRSRRRRRSRSSRGTAPTGSTDASRRSAAPSRRSYEGGDHWIVVGRVQSLHRSDEAFAPLVFFRGRYGRLERTGDASPQERYSTCPPSSNPSSALSPPVSSMALALGFVSLFTFPMFTGWVAYFLLCVIPMQIVVAVTWGADPGFVADGSQPAKGLAADPHDAGRRRRRRRGLPRHDWRRASIRRRRCSPCAASSPSS